MLIHVRRSFEPPPRLTDVERSSTMKVLGVKLRDDLNASTHITEILAECSRSMYALRILRSHGLPTTALHDVTIPIPPWLNVCKLLRSRRALLWLSTVSFVEHVEWGRPIYIPC